MGIKERIIKNTSCPNCGNKVISAKKRVVFTLVLEEKCPYCKTTFEVSKTIKNCILVTSVMAYVPTNRIFWYQFNLSDALDLVVPVVSLAFFLVVFSLIFGFVGLIFSPLVSK